MAQQAQVPGIRGKEVKVKEKRSAPPKCGGDDQMGCGEVHVHGRIPGQPEHLGASKWSEKDGEDKGLMLREFEDF